jgi:hypothetical protein
MRINKLGFVGEGIQKKYVFGYIIKYLQDLQDHACRGFFLSIMFLGAVCRVVGTCHVMSRILWIMTGWMLLLVRVLLFVVLLTTLFASDKYHFVRVRFFVDKILELNFFFNWKFYSI